MAVKIRLTRVGAKNDITFRVVATDSRSPRGGRYLELLGWYDPRKNGVNYSLKLDRIDAWLAKGAIPTETVRSLIKKARKAKESA